MKRSITGILSRLLVLGLVIIGTSCGSSSGTDVGNVRGKISYKGQLLDGGTITFHSVDEKGPVYPGKIEADGTYAMLGVRRGKYKVTVETGSSGAGGGSGSGVSDYMNMMKQKGAFTGGGGNTVASTKEDPATVAKERMAKMAKGGEADKYLSAMKKGSDSNGTKPVPGKYKSKATSDKEITVKSGDMKDVNIDLTD